MFLLLENLRCQDICDNKVHDSLKATDGIDAKFWLDLSYKKCYKKFLSTVDFMHNNPLVVDDCFSDTQEYIMWKNPIKCETLKIFKRILHN